MLSAYDRGYFSGPDEVNPYPKGSESYYSFASGQNSAKLDEEYYSTFHT